MTVEVEVVLGDIELVRRLLQEQNIAAALNMIY
jgi:hypothetical protein